MTPNSTSAQHTRMLRKVRPMGSDRGVQGFTMRPNLTDLLAPNCKYRSTYNIRRPRRCGSRCHKGHRVNMDCKYRSTCKIRLGHYDFPFHKDHRASSWP